MSQPLRGRRILITRPQHQAAHLQQALTALGADVVALPLIRIASLGQPDGPDSAPVQRWVTELASTRAAGATAGTAGWLVVTSANGAAALAWAAAAWGQSAGGTALLRRFQLAAVGPVTAQKLAEHGLATTLMPDVYTGEALAAALAPRLRPGEAVTLARGNLASPLLPGRLQAAGANVTELVVYNTLPDEAGAAAVQRELLAGAVDTVVFTSPSAVEACLLPDRETAVKLLRKCRLAAIGPVTAAALARAGLTGAIVAPAATAASLAAALVAAAE